MGDDAMHTKPQPEHHWLGKLVGRWTNETECNMGPGQPTMKMKGTDVVRSLGGLWIVAEGEGDTPDGGTGKMILTLGYDPTKKRFVGTFIASMMTHMWLYEGSLDPSGRKLTLDTEGPDFTKGGMARYQDIIEFIDDDHRTLTSQVLGSDGQWHRIVNAHYRRVK